MRKLTRILFLICLHKVACAQVSNVRLDNDLLWRYQAALNETENFHSSIKPYFYPELKNKINIALLDSACTGYVPTHTNYLNRKIFSENLIVVNTGLLHFSADPILNFQEGQSF